MISRLKSEDSEKHHLQKGLFDLFFVDVDVAYRPRSNAGGCLKFPHSPRGSHNQPEFTVFFFWRKTYRQNVWLTSYYGSSFTNIDQYLVNIVILVSRCWPATKCDLPNNCSKPALDSESKSEISLQCNRCSTFSKKTMKNKDQAKMMMNGLNCGQFQNALRMGEWRKIMANGSE